MLRRMSQLSDQWADFCALREARVLCWQLTAGEVSLFDAFIEMESDERTAEHATVFITLEEPFEDARQHGRSLSLALSAGLAQGESELQALSLPTGFKLPAPVKDEPDTVHLVRVCDAFLRFFELRTDLALILRPRAVADLASYQTWVLSLATAAGEQLRIIVLDDADRPGFTQLADAGSERIVCRRAGLTVPDALLELSDAAGNLDTPGGKLRDLFLRTGKALQEGDLERALAHGDAAVELTQAHRLWHLAVPVHVALAANLLAKDRQDEGLARYAAACAAAVSGCEQEDPALAELCKKLHLQSRLAHGAGLAGLRRWQDAAVLFEETLPLTVAAGEGIVQLDCHRLISFCHEQGGDAERAWRAGAAGLAHAHTFDPEQREHGNFKALAEALQRMAASKPARVARPVLDELSELRRRQLLAAEQVA